MTDNIPVLLNLACGNKLLPRPWVNVDLVLHPANTLTNDVVYIEQDITNLDTFEQVDHILASHVIEHFDVYRVEEIFTHWHSKLKPGGSLAVEVPDLIRCCQNVIRGYIEKDSELYMGMGLLGLFGDVLASKDNPLMMHKWAWSDRDLIGVAKRAGFKTIRRELTTQKPFASKIRDLRLVFVKEGEEVFNYEEYY